MEPTTSTPTYQGFGETRVPMAPSEIQCDWCCDMATSKIIEPCSLDGVAYACVVHGTEWYPNLFPESDTTPIEEIVEEIQSRVNLDKVSDAPLTGWEAECLKSADRSTARPNALPWYPLMGHREGLRRNDPVTLASALFILALEGGTAHSPAPIPGTVDDSGTIIAIRF